MDDNKENIKRLLEDAGLEKLDLPDENWKPFFPEGLYTGGNRTVFLTMDNMDALAIMAADHPAVGIEGSDNYYLLLKLLQDRPTDKTLIICDDRTGAISDLADGLRELNIPFVYENLCGDYDSPDDFYTADPAAFRDVLAETQRKALKPDSVADYIKYDMAAEIEKLRQDAGRKTGFSNLDAEAGSLYAGLYVVGGISSVGKTTFVAQLADQLAASGQHVLFFSLEQSRLEMVSKSIARRMAVKDMDRAVTSLQIRTGAAGENITEAVREYTAAVGDRISVIEGNFYCTVPYIAEYARDYIRRNNTKPVIIVDYLQVITAAVDPDTGRKPADPRQIVDANITALKRISRSLDVPVIVVSSVNRGNYLTPLDFESFKESGAIEFTSDVVWGLQLTAIHADIFSENNKLAEKRETIAQAKAQIPREIELVCLKNRYGKSRYSCTFTYYPQYDYFIPDTDFKPTDDRENPFAGIDIELK